MEGKKVPNGKKDRRVTAPALSNIEGIYISLDITLSRAVPYCMVLQGRQKKRLIIHRALLCSF